MARYTTLRVWHEARAALREISGAVGAMPSEGDLKSQIRRAAISIVSNISEGSERGSDALYANHLRMARGSCAEAQAQLTIAGDLGLIDEARVQALTTRLDTILRMLSGLVRYLDGP